MSVFETLNAINVNDKTEQKNGLTYLSWAFAWGEAKKNYPEASYTVYENTEGWNYFTDGKTCWVKTGVTIEGLEHIEYLPVMDYRNKSISLSDVTSFDVNKAIQRSLTKALARHGLGLYIYAGEDLPDTSVDEITLKTFIDKVARYAEKKNGNAEELLKYYLKRSKVNHQKELSQKQAEEIVEELTNLIRRVDNETNK